eukprot:scaffold1796_cov60-Cyclotella_meneghiniana.AAC.9
MPAMICSSWHTGPVTRSKNKRKNESLGRAVAQKSRVLKRISKKDSVLVKHLAWLRELQENKTRLQEEKKLEEERKLERRRLLKENRHSNTKKLVWLVSQANGTSSLGEATSSPSPKTDEARSKVERPAWCRPEATQSEAEEHADDENALLDYIDQLNFDQYNEDLELQTLIGQVKDRIKSLEKDKRKDEKMLKACTDSENAAIRSDLVKGSTFIDEVPLEPEIVEVEDDTESIAETVMSNESAIKSIHSRQSVKLLVTKAKERALDPIDEKEAAMTPPVSIRHTDDDGARLEEMKSLNKLAFKHRNPAL